MLCDVTVLFLLASTQFAVWWLSDDRRLRNGVNAMQADFLLRLLFFVSSGRLIGLSSGLLV